MNRSSSGMQDAIGAILEAESEELSALIEQGRHLTDPEAVAANLARREAQVQRFATLNEEIAKRLS